MKRLEAMFLKSMKKQVNLTLVVRFFNLRQAEYSHFST